MIYSYSAVKDFENCPRKFHETRVLKRFKSKDTAATLYGTAVHKAFEDYVRDNTPLPPEHERFLEFVAPLKRIKGTVLCEEKLAMRADFVPCDFFAEDAWFRGITDYLTLNFETGVARVGDYKTGKSSKYADTAQLELMAILVMSKYPSIMKVKGALLFVVAKDVITTEYHRNDMSMMLSKWAGKVLPIEMAMENGVWNPKQSGLCGFCPCESCESYKPRW